MNVNKDREIIWINKKKVMKMTKQKFELVTIDDLKKTNEIKKSELRLEFEKDSSKKTGLESTVQKIIKAEGAKLSGKVHNDDVVSFDSGENCAVAVRDMYLDEYSETAGLSRKVAVYVIDLDNKKIIGEDGPTTYRDGKNSYSDNWRIAYKQVKVLGEDKKTLTVGLKSNEELIIQRVDKKTGSRKTIERYDLEAERKEQKKLESIDQAINDLDHSALVKVIESIYGSSQLIDTKKISDTLTLAGVFPYHGDLTSQDLYLAIKGKGILKLGSISFDYHSRPNDKNNYNTIDLEDAKITFLEDTFMVEGKSRKYTDVYQGGSRTLQVVEYRFEIDNSLDESAPRKGDLEHAIEENKKNFLNHGNLNNIPIAMHGFRKEAPTNYPYDIQRIMSSDGSKAYVVVTKVIDLESYIATYSIVGIEPQLNVSVYEVSDLGTKKPILKEIGSITTDTNDRKKYALSVDYDSDSGYMSMSKPEITCKGNTLKVKMKVIGDEVKEKTFSFELRR